MNNNKKRNFNLISKDDDPNPSKKIHAEKKPKPIFGYSTSLSTVLITLENEIDLHNIRYLFLKRIFRHSYCQLKTTLPNISDKEVFKILELLKAQFKKDEKKIKRNILKIRKAFKERK